jgi:hypothetical protein
MPGVVRYRTPYDRPGDLTTSADAMQPPTDVNDDGKAIANDECLASEHGTMTLEAIVDVTGEFEHLNELVMLHIKKAGGLNCIDDYFTTVTPILDLLEVEIRVRYAPGITIKQMKLVIQDWIDNEIATLK